MDNIPDEDGYDSVDGSDPKFDAFITNIVIPNSEKQRKRWQFASLILQSASEAQDRHTFHYKPSNRHGRPLLNRNNTLSPDPGHFNNYIIARPEKCRDDMIHAEAAILHNFQSLWEAHVKINCQNPVSIIFYSWIMPCTECTDLIIQGLSNLGVSVTIAYTIPWDKE